METPERIRAGRETMAECARWAPFWYLLLATPLSLFLYVNTFKDAWTFFAGHSDSLLIRHPSWFVGAITLLGGWMLVSLNLPGRRWFAAAWLFTGTAAAVLIGQDNYHWGRPVAFTLCVPGWIALIEWTPRVWRGAGRPAGDLKLWILAGVLPVAAAVLSSIAHATYNLLLAPNLDLPAAVGAQVIARVAAIAALLGSTGCLPALFVVLLLRRVPQTSRLLLAATALALGMGIGGILVYGIWRVDTFYLRPTHFLYVTALITPVIARFCLRTVTAGMDLAEGFVGFGRSQFNDPAGNPSPLWRRLAPWICLGAFVVVQLIVGKLQLYYGWGGSTSFLYSGVALVCTWYLLTHLPRRLQLELSGAALTIACVGLVLLPMRHDSATWTGYLKFDQNLGPVVMLFQNRNPRPEPELARVRDRILESGKVAIGSDLRRWHQQQLARREKSRRPHVFFIVADALRRDIYGGRPGSGQRFPGLAWMSRRFVTYDNAWTSYNSTVGSYPAYLNGVLHPAWYRIAGEDGVRHDNVLARAGELAGYRCYNFSSYMREFDYLWPATSKVMIPESGTGLGDPAVLLPLALKLLDEHCAADPAAPALFYIHLYNLHQPLLRRPGVPFDGSGRHWMQALYEHNVLYFDQQLLVFLQALEQRGLLGDSLVVLTSDHGEEFFDLGGLYHGWHLNPPVMHVPLLVHYPAAEAGALPAGTASPRPVNLIDVAPTICDVMGISIRRESDLQGISLLSPDENPDRTFPLFGWCNPLVGQVSFSPPQMLVLDAVSGAVDCFQRDEHGWQLQSESTDPLPLARRLNAELDKLFEFWEPDRIKTAAAKGRNFSANP